MSHYFEPKKIPLDLPPFHLLLAISNYSFFNFFLVSPQFECQGSIVYMSRIIYSRVNPSLHGFIECVNLENIALTCWETNLIILHVDKFREFLYMHT